MYKKKLKTYSGPVTVILLILFVTGQLITHLTKSAHPERQKCDVPYDDSNNFANKFLTNDNVKITIW